MPKILIVEDDADIVENLSVLLQDEGFSFCHAPDTKGALDLLHTENIDLVLLDITLSDGNGYSVCTAVKRLTNAPVIFLTAMTDESSIITGFQLGADDYITKPFKPMELICRVRNALRKSGKVPSVFQVEDLHIDATKGIVIKAGTELTLSALEYRLLLVFLNHFGETLSRRDVLHEIWDIAGDYVNDNTLTVYIKRLRDKIETDPANPVILKTVRGVGYKVGD
ncbi:MAG: response regulator transcription factor [Bacteroidaceae bacterium]|nr:response regulator transcription factor [Bacteroidaceae bacterium]MBQ3517698.1 response regulator transcription factor [Clostridia bacterium]